MTDASPAAFWLRYTSAALTAWCAFWGPFGAATTLASYAALADGKNLGEPGTTVGHFYVAVLALAGGLVSFLTTRWQWTRMRHSRASDHRNLAIVLLVVGIALAPQPFVSASF